MDKHLSAWLTAAVLALASLPALAGTTTRSPEPRSEPRPEARTEFSPAEVSKKAADFFGDTTEGLAKAIEKLFAEQGRPNAIITGEEGGGAVVVGLRYGHGTLETASGLKREIFWQGPSVGFDIGGNAAKVLTLIYNLDDVERMYQRFPGIEGSLYFVAGLSLNYHRSGDITVAPIRTGVGWRQGANIGYLHYTKKRSLNPL